RGGTAVARREHPRESDDGVDPVADRREDAERERPTIGRRGLVQPATALAHVSRRPEQHRELIAIPVGLRDGLQRVEQGGGLVVAAELLERHGERRADERDVLEDAEPEVELVALAVIALAARGIPGVQLDHAEVTEREGLETAGLGRAGQRERTARGAARGGVAPQAG